MRSKSLMAAAMLYALAAGVGAPSLRLPAIKPPRTFTDERKAAVEAKRQRKNAKRAADARRQRGGT